jgi:hypothetical protein
LSSRQLVDCFVRDKLVVFSHHMSDNTLALKSTLTNEICNFNDSIVFHCKSNLGIFYSIFVELHDKYLLLAEYQLFFDFFDVRTDFSAAADATRQAILATYGGDIVSGMVRAARPSPRFLARFDIILHHYNLNNGGVSVVKTPPSTGQSSAASTLSSTAGPSTMASPGLFFDESALPGPSAAASTGPASTTSAVCGRRAGGLHRGEFDF